MKHFPTSALIVSMLALVYGPPSAQSAEVDEAVLAAEAARVAVVAQAKTAALAILEPGGQGGGSGVLISADGYALTNYHVTRGAGDAMQCGMTDGRLYDAVIVGIDPVGDVALIKLFGRDDFPFAEMADSDEVRVGDWAFAVGNPFLLATDLDPTVTYGMISGVHRYQYPAGTLLEYADCIQTDASINPGNSGGPLFDGQGRLIGINGRGSFEKRGRVNVGVGYAISINQIKYFLGCLKSGRIIDHATLGAEVTTSPDGRVLVGRILESSDAYRRGLRKGDEIVRFGGRPIGTVNAFKNVLGIYPRDWRVPLSFRRNGETHDLIVRLAGVHNPEKLIEMVQGKPRPESPSGPEPPPRGDRRRRGPGGPPRPTGENGREPPPMPKIVADHFSARRGFANYYFNEMHQHRAWDAFVERGEFSALVGSWTIRTAISIGGDADFFVTDRTVRGVFPGGQLTLVVDDDLTDAVDPPGSGGLLAALYLWRRMLIVGPDRFGAVVYQGQYPLPGYEELLDTLVATHAAVECRFMFNPTTGQLVALECWLRPDDDPCELIFSQYEDVVGRSLPTQIDVHYGSSLYGSYKVNDYSLEPVGVQ